MDFKTLKFLFLIISFMLYVQATETTEKLRSLNTAEPAGALPALKAAVVYKDKGVVSMLEDLPIYEVGTGGNAIVMIYDIYGFNSGRTREMCDQFAAAGYYVILPDFFRGNGRLVSTFNMMNYPWVMVKDLLERLVYPHVEKRGIKVFNVVGACYGGAMAFYASQNAKVVSSVSFHPAAGLVQKPYDTFFASLVAPQMIIPSGGEPAEFKEGGIVQTTLETLSFKGKNIVKSYNNMSHGFVPRGDLAVPEIKTAVDAVMAMAIQFIKDNDPMRASAQILSMSVFMIMSLLFIFFN
jgi:dienelactone hydrolase